MEHLPSDFPFRRKREEEKESESKNVAGPSGGQPELPVRTFAGVITHTGRMSCTAQTLGVIPAEELGNEGTESAVGGPEVGFGNLVF